MLHKMKLNESPFERIKNGTKTIEFRLYDEKRQKIKVGDKIEFSKLPNLKEKLLVDVVELYKEDTFEKLFRKLYSDEEEIMRKTKAMYKIYSPEKEQQYGVLGIKINTENKYNIITLCGSIKFKNKFMEIQEKLTLNGNIVFIPNFFNSINKEEIKSETKKMLDEMHRQKIDMSDEIYVINLEGYIGESTKAEIEYAKTKGKRICYLESVK